MTALTRGNTFELKTYTQWKVGTDVTDWIFYNDDTYTLTLTSYYDRNAWYDGTSLASAEVTFQGRDEAHHLL